MTFKEADLKTYGLRIISLGGMLDLPKRKGQTEYDWGDLTEPLVSVDDIYFGTRDIIVDALWDERLGVSFEDAMGPLRAITTTETLSTQYGDFQVKLHEIKVLKNYKGGKTVRLRFTELNPDLSGGLPTTTGSSSVRIDGYDLFTQFGLLVESTVLHEIAQLKSSRQTTFKNNYLSLYRKPQELNVKVNGIYASSAEMSTKISQLNALLAKEGLRHFVHYGTGFQCYVTEGYKVDVKKTRVSITLKLKVGIMYDFDEIVQAVINQIELQARPQSDLSETDDTQASYVVGKDTFKAVDSNKLNGETADFYAKEAEVKALRDLDLASSLETLTPEI